MKKFLAMSALICTTSAFAHPPQENAIRVDFELKKNTKTAVINISNLRCFQLFEPGFPTRTEITLPKKLELPTALFKHGVFLGHSSREIFGERSAPQCDHVAELKSLADTNGDVEVSIELNPAIEWNNAWSEAALKESAVMTFSNGYKLVSYGVKMIYEKNGQLID